MCLWERLRTREKKRQAQLAKKERGRNSWWEEDKESQKGFDQIPIHGGR